MEADTKSEEVLVLFKALTNTDHVHPERRLTLTKETPVIAIGRSSKRRVELEPSHTNAFFDCPVMSREHAELHLDSEKRSITIQDTGSLHGTLLNKLALRPTETRVINTGDIISFGLAINRGADEFTPHQVEATVTWKDPKSSRNVGTYRVPDDTDIEELSDKDDGAPEMTYARRVLRENNYHVGDFQDNHIDLTSPRLPPISSFDTPSHATVMVDLTSDDTGLSRRFDSSTSSRPLQPSDEGFPKLPEYNPSSHGLGKSVPGGPMFDDFFEEDDDGSYASPSDDLDMSDDPEIESSDEEHGADFNLSEAEISEEEAGDVWGIDVNDDDLAGLDVDDAVPKANGFVDNLEAPLPVDNGPASSNIQFSGHPIALPMIYPAGMDQKSTGQPSFAPADLAFNPDAHSLSTSGHRQGNTSAFKADKADFFKAREENRRTLGLPPKAGEANSGSQRKEASPPGYPDSIMLNNGPGVDLKNELLRNGGDFLNEPIKDVEANQGAAEDEDPVLDETSAYQFQMSKKAASQAADAKVALAAEPCNNVEEMKKASPKRKSDNISESTPEEEQAMKPELAATKKAVSSASAITPVLSARGRQCDPITLSGPCERPVKRLRRAVEAVGYAAIGGIAVMSALIATAPQL